MQGNASLASRRRVAVLRQLPPTNDKPYPTLSPNVVGSLAILKQHREILTSRHTAQPHSARHTGHGWRKCIRTLSMPATTHSRVIAKRGNGARRFSTKHLARKISHAARFRAAVATCQRNAYALATTATDRHRGDIVVWLSFACSLWAAALTQYLLCRSCRSMICVNSLDPLPNIQGPSNHRNFDKTSIRAVLPTCSLLIVSNKPLSEDLLSPFGVHDDHLYPVANFPRLVIEPITLRFSPVQNQGPLSAGTVRRLAAPAWRESRSTPPFVYGRRIESPPPDSAGTGRDGVVAGRDL
jgi:hypothetical protein